jgi:hypothetical protein
MYPIRIRADHENGTDLSLTEAVQVAIGNGLSCNRICVTAVYAEDTEGDKNRAGVARIYKTGEAVFGMDAEVHTKRTRFGDDQSATVSISGISSHSPELAMIRVQCYMIAAQIAAAANAAAAAAPNA